MIGQHLVVTTLAGRASLTVHRRSGEHCIPVSSMVLEPDEVLALATALTRASVPEPPVVAKRIEIRRDEDSGLWRFECPECFPVEGTFFDQPAALEAAYRHIGRDHAEEQHARQQGVAS